MNHLSRLHTYLRLGIPNLARVLFYKVGLKLGVHPAQKNKVRDRFWPLFPCFRTNVVLPESKSSMGTLTNTIWVAS